MSVRVQDRGRLRAVTLANGESNFLTLEMCRAIVDAIEEAETDRGIGAILLEAEGRVFSGGIDLDEAADPDNTDHGFLHHKLFSISDRISKPLVAAVHGAALAEGMALVANAHVAVAAQGTSFGLTEIRAGLFPFAGFEALSRAIGERRATELALTGRIFAAPEALQMGLVHEVAPAFEYDDRAQDIAAKLAYSSPEAVHRGLEFVHKRRSLSALDAGTLGLKLRAGLFRGEDFREGWKAVREQRPAKWPSLEGH
ncbi:MAG: enoyl-CoA hydratase/isomerase family protein [Bryobacteraceae bacterium]|nr:enoyl-CoA hydratase/isomerase family protein [Bryobacteraceae bacterium]